MLNGELDQVDTPKWASTSQALFSWKNPLLWYSIACTTCLLYLISWGEYVQYFAGTSNTNTILPTSHWKYEAARDADNFGLTPKQCTIAFPDLYKPITDNVRKLARRISQADLDFERRYKEVRVLVWENAVYVVDDFPDELVPNRKFATLLALQRALTAVAATGERFPNIEFLFAFSDKTADEKRPIWAYDRTIGTTAVWLMPDFGLYSWPAHGVGSYREVRQKIGEIEAGLTNGFAGKIPKLIWKGTVDFGATVRHSLLDVSAGKSWSAVESLNWFGEDIKERMITMPEHCRYKYLAYTEGLAYSGRLKYLHNCESVIIAHEPKYETHVQHLWKRSGTLQNIVVVPANFSTLDEEMSFLLTHEEDSQRIAKNNVETFRDRFLTPAAEGCYWRQMIREWGRNSFEPEFYHTILANATDEAENGSSMKRWRGTPLETFILSRSLELDVRLVGREI